MDDPNTPSETGGGRTTIDNVGVTLGLTKSGFFDVGVRVEIWPACNLRRGGGSIVEVG